VLLLLSVVLQTSLLTQLLWCCFVLLLPSGALRTSLLAQLLVVSARPWSWLAATRPVACTTS
jgi:hypothetical protein